MLGVGRVWQVPEFETFQIDQTQSREMFAEAIEVIHRAWTEDTFSHEEKFWQFKDVSIFQKPVQKPTPPIFWTVVTPGSYEKAAAAGYSVIRSLNFVSLETVEIGTAAFEAEIQKKGKQLSDYEMPLTAKVYVAATDEEAERDAAPNAQWFYKQRTLGVPARRSGPHEAG